MRESKLVRDLIPDIIRSKGQIPIVHTATDEEFRKKILEKLTEEVGYFLEAALLNDRVSAKAELIDIYDVVQELINLYFSRGYVDLWEGARLKAISEGTFKRRIIWEGNDEARSV